MKWRSTAKTLTYVSLISWVLFVLLELAVPTLVSRIFNPHWFLLLFLAGAVWWYNLLIKK